MVVCLSAAAIAQKAPPSKPFERFDGCVLESEIHPGKYDVVGIRSGDD